MANNINQIVDSLISVHKVIENFRLQRKKTELYDSNSFNPFQFLRTDEMGLSKILAFLLDPKETHGQRDLFLNSFLKFINKHQFLAYEKVNIYVEKPTSGNRRHDIFIEGWLDNKRAWVISIENKLQGAVDQDKQMNDYAEDLRTYAEESYFLIYLPIFGDNPSKESISEKQWLELVHNKKAVVLSASMIIKWLDNTVIVSPIINQFCNHFKKFLSEDIMGNTQNTNELVECLINNDKALFSALTVLETKETLYEKLMAMLVEQLKIRFNRYTSLVNYGFECREYGKINQKRYELNISNDNFGIAIIFNRKDLAEPFYGIYAHKKKIFNWFIKYCNEFIIENNFDEPEGIFPLSKWLEDDYEKWDAKILSKIPSGELASYIFDLWKPLLDIISDNLDEIKAL